MGRLISILVCQWRAYWRGFARSGKLTAGNQGVMLIISLLVLYKYVRALSVAGNELPRGKTAMLERLLLVLFLAWLFPLLSASRLSVTTRSLHQWPFSLTELFVLKAGSLFVTPFAWLVLIASVAIVYPIAQSPNPLAGMLASSLYILISWLFGLTIAQLLSISLWRKLFVLVVIVVTGTVAYLGQGSTINLQRQSFAPARFVAQAALGERLTLNVLVLAVLVVVASCIALWSFRFSLEHFESPAAKTTRIQRLFVGKMGPMSAKDVRYFSKLLDPYFGVFAAALGCLYLVIASEPQREVFWIFIILIFFPNASLTFNSFGLDSRQGLERYALLPISGREIISSKNIAYSAAMVSQVLPLMLFALWRLSVEIVAYGILEAALVALAYLTWGNMIAVNQRFKMEFYRFSSGGSPIEGLVGVIFGTLPGAIAIQLFVQGLWWVSVLMLFTYATFYWFSSIAAGRKVDRGLLITESR